MPAEDHRQPGHYAIPKAEDRQPHVDISVMAPFPLLPTDECIYNPDVTFQQFFGDDHVSASTLPLFPSQGGSDFNAHSVQSNREPGEQPTDFFTPCIYDPPPYLELQPQEFPYGNESFDVPLWQIAPYQPMVEPSPQFGVMGSTSLSISTVPRAEIVSMPANPREESSYASDNNFSGSSKHYATLVDPERRQSRPFGPERSSAPKKHRKDPLLRKQRAKKTSGVSLSGACWRCRKYRKPCNDGPFCTSCKVGGFRVWPPSLGCRRDNLEAYVFAMFPPKAEDLLQLLPPEFTPLPNWRMSVAGNFVSKETLFPDPGHQRWSSLAVKVQATQMYGLEFVDLLNIVKTYQAAQSIKSPLLEAACAVTSSTSDLYNIFVYSYWGQLVSPPKSQIATVVHEVRASLARTFNLFVRHCVSPNRADWFPTVLALCLVVVSGVMFLDTAIAVPAATRRELWGDVQSFNREVRGQFYATLLDLLRVRANNDKVMAPLQLNCWTKTTTQSSSSLSAPASTPVSPSALLSASASAKIPALASASAAASASASSSSQSRRNTGTKQTNISVPPATHTAKYNIGDTEHPTNTLPPISSTPQTNRNPEGMRLVGGNEAAFDGFANLQAWLRANEETLKEGRTMFTNDPYTMGAVAPISALSLLFKM